MQTIKIKFGHGVDFDTETRDKLSDNGWTIDYCEKENNNPHNIKVDDVKDNINQSRTKGINEMLSRRLERIGKYFEGKANK
jgi:FAD synthase